MATCKECIHYEPCFMYGNILDPIHGGVKCDSFKPTADVAPKTEVERLERILNSYALQYGTVTDQQKVIDKAKSEVAREIFEEIRHFSRKPFPEAKEVYILKESELKQLEKRYWVGDEDALKKKYTEGE